MIRALAVIAAFAVTAPPPPPARWVEDDAGMLTPATRAALDNRLETYERATNHQIVVWIGHTIDGAPLADWAVATFASWKLGRKGFDDGLAIFVLADDRKIDIEVGYGLEPVVPDAVASRIIHDVMAPRLAVGDPNGAVTMGVEGVLAAIEGRPWDGGGMPPAKAPLSTGQIIGSILLAGLALFLLIRHPGLFVLLLSMLGRGQLRWRRRARRMVASRASPC
jgi:uncharacterized protein